MSAHLAFLWEFVEFLPTIILGDFPLQLTYSNLHDIGLRVCASEKGIPHWDSGLVRFIFAKVNLPGSLGITRFPRSHGELITWVQMLSHGPGLRLREDTAFCERFCCARPLMPIRMFPGPSKTFVMHVLLAGGLTM